MRNPKRNRRASDRRSSTAMHRQRGGHSPNPHEFIDIVMVYDPSRFCRTMPRRARRKESGR